MKKVVLAFSGGLDTSYCAKYLSAELGYEVHAVTVNTGGFNSKDQKDLELKALELGALRYRFIDETSNFYQKGVKYLLFGNVLKNNTFGCYHVNESVGPCGESFAIELLYDHESVLIVWFKCASPKYPFHRAARAY